MAILAYLLLVLVIVYIYSKQIIKHRETITGYKSQLEAYKKLIPDFGTTIPLTHYKEAVGEKTAIIKELDRQVSELLIELKDIKSQQQSKSVRLGLISENVLPFHSDFKYNVKDLVPMFRPIDYIVFTEDEIVFLEIKIGTSTLSEKQRNIKNLIELGKVRFEEHRVTELAYTVKEYNGKETKS